MKTKFLLPVLAMIFAVGMSFTSIEENPTGLYVEINGDPVELEMDPCEGTTYDCKVAFESDPGTEHIVYLDENLSQAARSSNPFAIIIPDIE